MFYNKNIYCLLCSCANPIFGKSLVLEIWAKMFSANQIAGFFNQLYLQSKSVKYLIFCMLLQIHVKVDPKNFGWACSEMAVSQEKIDEMNWFFACWCKFRKLKSYFNDFLVAMVKKRAWPFSSWELIICWISLLIELIFWMLTVMQ